MQLSTTVTMLIAATQAADGEWIRAFNEDPKGTLDWTQSAIIQGLNDGVDIRDAELLQNQQDLE